MEAKKFENVIQKIKKTGNKIDSNLTTEIYKNKAGEYLCIKSDGIVIFSKENVKMTRNADGSFTTKTVTQEMFSSLRKEIETPENLKFEGSLSRVYEDEKGRVFRLEDDGYTEVLVVDSWVYSRSFDNKISIEPIISRKEEEATTIQVTFFKEEIEAIGKKTSREISDKEALHDAIIDIVSDVVKEVNPQKPLEISEYMKSLPDTTLLQLTKEVDEFIKTGILPEKATIGDISDLFGLTARDIERKILEEATNRFGFLVSCLLKATPGTFLK